MPNKTFSPVICLMGPTAVGKTQLALAVASRLPCMIISVDSMLVYRYLNIGTAKPTSAELKRTAHRLINIREPDQVYSVGQFCEDVQEAIADARAAGRIPLLVGGTMMYFYRWQEGLTQLPQGDEAVKQRLVQQHKEYGLSVLYQNLLRIDPDTAHRISPQDTQRIHRALEVYEVSGRPLSAWLVHNHHDRTSKTVHSYRDDPVTFVYNPFPRPILRAYIAQRFQCMLEQGLIAEVESVWRSGQVTEHSPSMRAVGYRQVIQYLKGNIDHETMVRNAVISTGQLAKRQQTWLKRWPKAHVLRMPIEQAVETLLAKLNFL